MTVTAEIAKDERWDNFSSLDHRYFEDLEKMQPFLTERALVAYMVRVLVALVRVLGRRGICSQAIVTEVEEAAPRVMVEMVAEIEAKIHHDVRSVVEAFRRQVSDVAKPYLHWCLTSFDVKSTAEAARIRDAIQMILLPEMLELETWLVRTAYKEATTPIMGRTHGQHAEPITLGFTFASYARRFGGRIETLKWALPRLHGKISGATGAHNSFRLFVDDPLLLEEEVLADPDINLTPDPLSTQITAPEEMMDIFWVLETAGGVLANIADDMRNLARTEIGEIFELFVRRQSGSSTMPHKRNPWNFENVKSGWKRLLGRLLPIMLDQISEHQRDLTNSQSGRDVPESVAIIYLMVVRLKKTFAKARFDRGRMKKNMKMTKDFSLAEPLYLALAATGHPTAHERVKDLTLDAEEAGTTLARALAKAEDLVPWLEQMDPKLRRRLQALFRNPRSYNGIAAEKTIGLCEHLAEQFEFTLEEAA